MTSEQFCFWLKGLLAGTNGKGISEEGVKLILTELNKITIPIDWSQIKDLGTFPPKPFDITY